MNHDSIDFTVQFDQIDDTYRPGDTVSGSAQLLVVEPTEVLRVEIRLEYYVQVDQVEPIREVVDVTKIHDREKWAAGTLVHVPFSMTLPSSGWQVDLSPLRVGYELIIEVITLVPFERVVRKDNYPAVTQAIPVEMTWNRLTFEQGPVQRKRHRRSTNPFNLFLIGFAIQIPFFALVQRNLDPRWFVLGILVAIAGVSIIAIGMMWRNRLFHVEPGRTELTEERELLLDLQLRPRWTRKIDRLNGTLQLVVQKRNTKDQFIDEMILVQGQDRVWVTDQRVEHAEPLPLTWRFSLPDSIPASLDGPPLTVRWELLISAAVGDQVIWTSMIELNDTYREASRDESLR